MKTSQTPRSYLVTGGAGFIGSNLVRKLVASGHRVLNIDKLTYAGNLSSLDGISDSINYQFLRADVVDSEALRETVTRFKPDRILHLAAESHVDRSIDDPLEFVRTNVLGTVTLLQTAHSYFSELDENEKDGFAIILVSTDEVFGSLGETGHFTEKSRYDPRSPYSASKASSEHFAKAWAHTYGLPIIITNCSNCYGPYQFPEKLIPLVILKALAGESIPVYGTGENVRDWLHVEDFCEALIRVSENGVTGESYNIGGGNELRNIEVVRMLCDHLDHLKPRKDGRGYGAQIEFVKDRPGHDFRYAIDAGKIIRELDWRPKRTAGDGFRETVAWYLENEAWVRAVLDGSYRLERLGLIR